MTLSTRWILAGISAVLIAGCATEHKNLRPVAGTGPQSQFIKGLDVVEQPALEPEWADYVKEKYPYWRQHYWVDRGNWGNRGYLVGHPPTKEVPRWKRFSQCHRRQPSKIYHRRLLKPRQLRLKLPPRLLNMLSKKAIHSGRLPVKFITTRSSGCKFTAPTKPRLSIRTRFMPVKCS